MIGDAVRVMRIATGDEADDLQDDGKDPAAKALGAKGGKKRAENITPENLARAPLQPRRLHRLDQDPDRRQS